MGYGMRHRGYFIRRFLTHRIWSVGLVVFSVILLFLGHGKNDQLEETRAVISSYTSPVLAALSTPFTFANEAAKDVGRLVSLKEEVDRLKNENDKLRHMQTVALQKDIKLKQLQNFLNLKIDSRIKYLTARVIANVNSPYKDTIRLNVGRENGVAKGQAVIDQNGFLGQIIRVDSKSASVLLISDINSRIPVRLEPDGVSAMLVGKQNDGVELKYLPYGYDLKVGTQILTSGHGSRLPAGILIGRVAKQDDYLAVKLLSNLAHATYVKVLELKDAQRGEVTKAVMKLPPLPQERQSIRKSFSPGNTAGQKTAKMDLSRQEGHSGLEDNSPGLHINQSAGLLDLEKRASSTNKRTYRTYNRPRYVGWRYRQSYRDRRFRSQVFSSSLN